MIIANPIYDSVFKYLMEDSEIAKGLLSVILQTEVVEVQLRPQETSTETASEQGLPISIYRLDFVALIEHSDGTYRKVLIELQKTKRHTNIVRFRRYLGESYQQIEQLPQALDRQPLEIITIYFLGFTLDDVPTSVLRVENNYIDAIRNKPLSKPPQDRFVRLLNHESHLIQIPLLQPNLQNRLERILNLFSQKYQTDNMHLLNYPIDDTTPIDPLEEAMKRRLLRAAASEELRRKMDLEDEFDTEMRLHERSMAEQRAIIAQQNEALAQKDEALLLLQKEILALRQQLARKNEAD